MKLYVSMQTFIIPTEVLESLGKPIYINLNYDSDNKIIYISPDNTCTENSFDIPEKLYSNRKWKGLRIFGGNFGRRMCKDMKWQYTINQMEIEPYLALDENNEIVLVIPLQEAVPSEGKIAGHDYLLPIWQYEEMREEE